MTNLPEGPAWHRYNNDGYGEHPDGTDLPARELFRGRLSGSAMPLVWAHAEYIKLRRSLADGRVFDMPPQTVQRYLVQKTVSPHCAWRFNYKCRIMPRGRILRIELLAPARVHWSVDNWSSVQDQATRDSGLGLHLADLPTSPLAAGNTITFTFFWVAEERWEGNDFSVTVK